MTLKAVVIGAGYAGEGHTIALRAADVEVVAMVGRSEAPAIAMSTKLGIPLVYFDWRKALHELRPDIVSIATPVKPHLEIVTLAAQLGCHVVCEKPLGINSDEAQTMLQAVERAGIKHAYAATGRYAFISLFAHKLLSEGLIGPVRAIECLNHFDITGWPYYEWLHRLSEGGGMLNNAFTHNLAQVLYITNGKVQAVAGEAYQSIERAPVGEAMHDFREIFKLAATRKPVTSTEWRPVDADFGCLVRVQLQMPGGHSASVLFNGSATSTNRHGFQMEFYGDKGTLHVGDSNGVECVLHFDKARGEWQDLPIPQSLIDSMPRIDDPVQRNWNQFFREFIADVNSEGYVGYPTFRDGLLACEVIEIVRRGMPLIPLAESRAGSKAWFRDF